MARFARQRRSSRLCSERLAGLAHVAGPDPEDCAPSPLARGEAVDGGDVHPRVGQLPEIVGEGARAIVALDQEASLLRVEAQPGLPCRDLELPRIVGDDIDLRAATLRKAGAGEKVDAGADQ